MDTIMDLLEAGMIRNDHIVSIHFKYDLGSKVIDRTLAGKWYDDWILPHLKRRYHRCAMDDVGWDIWLEDDL